MKPHIPPHPHRLPRRAIRQHGVRMNTRTLRIPPRPSAFLETHHNPPVLFRVRRSGERLLKNFPLVGLRLEPAQRAQHHAYLRAQSGQRSIGSIPQPQLQVRAVSDCSGFRSERNTIGQPPFHRHAKPTVMALPVHIFNHDILFVPDCWNVRMRKKRQTQITEDRLRQIDHCISAACPRCEDAGLRPALWSDSALDESGPWGAVLQDMVRPTNS